MLKSDFYNRVARDIKLKRPDITVDKNTGYYGETLKLTVYKQLEPQPQRTNSLNKVSVICKRNVVDIIINDNGLQHDSKRFSNTTDYSHNQINMVVLTADAIIENVK